MSKFPAGRKVIYRCIEKLAHAKQCRDPYCSLLDCMDMKKHVDHYEKCCLGTKGGCGECVQLESICVYHTRTCRNKSCGVPFCSTIKERARRSQVSGETQQKSAGSAHRRSASYSGHSQQPPEYQPPPPYSRSASASKIELATPIDDILFDSMEKVVMATSMPCNIVNTWGPDQQVVSCSSPSISSDAFNVAISREHDSFLREVLGLDDDAKELQNNKLPTEGDVARSVEMPECEVQFFDEITSEDPFFSPEPICQIETATHSNQLTMNVLDATHSEQVTMNVLDSTHSDQLTMDVLDATHSEQVTMNVLDSTHSAQVTRNASDATDATTCRDSGSQDLSPPSTLKYIIQFLQKIEENPVLRDAFENDYLKSTKKPSHLGANSAQVRAGETPQPPVWGELEDQLMEDGKCSHLRRTESLPNVRQNFPSKDNNVLIQTYLVDPFLQ